MDLVNVREKQSFGTVFLGLDAYKAEENTKCSLVPLIKVTLQLIPFISIIIKLYSS